MVLNREATKKAGFFFITMKVVKEQLEQAQRGGRCLILRDIQSQVGQGSEKPNVVEDVPAYCRGFGLPELWRPPATKSIL